MSPDGSFVRSAVPAFVPIPFEALGPLDSGKASSVESGWLDQAETNSDLRALTRGALESLRLPGVLLIPRKDGQQLAGGFMAWPAAALPSQLPEASYLM